MSEKIITVLLCYKLAIATNLPVYLSARPAALQPSGQMENRPLEFSKPEF